MKLEDHLFDEILTLINVNSLPGKLISFDTLDGGGNSTQVALLTGYLRSRGVDVLETKEPTDEHIGRRIRAILRGEERLRGLSLQFLFVADRGDHLDKVILPGLKVGRWVVSARYALTTVAWGTGQGVPSWVLLAANAYYPWPNLNIVLMLSIDECLRRIFARAKRATDKLELFETRAYMEANEVALKQMAKKLPNVVLVDGMGTEEEVAARVWKFVEERLLPLAL